MFIPRSRLFWSVSIGHFTNDLFMSMGPVVLAFLSTTILPMTNAQIGLAVSAAQLLGAVSQPWFGLRADQRGGRWLASGGLMLLMSMFALSLIVAQITGQYWLMFVPFVLRALGSGMIHPVGSLHAAESDESHTASNMAYFFLMGQMGLAGGPAVAGYLLDLANGGTLMPLTASMIHFDGYLPVASLTPLFLFMLVALPGIVLTAISIPGAADYNRHATERDAKKAAAALDKPASPLPIMAFVTLSAVVALRALGQPGSVVFLPVLFSEKGWSPAEYGLITSSFWVASGIAGIVFGNLADRIDRRFIVMVSMVLSAPAFFFLPVVDGPLAFVLAMAAGGFAGGSHSIIVVLAQDLIPANKGFASGAILGLIFGAGALASAVIGALSDAIGLNTTFQLVAVAAVLSGVIALLLPARETPESSSQ